ncbi:MAG: hypothetical protein KC550_01675 [Nanoarchaeota archaeon]|nr:hypothetical protein [Nanoarchaeota archaeon]
MKGMITKYSHTRVFAQLLFLSWLGIVLIKLVINYGLETTYNLCHYYMPWAVR